uniref:Uncharacterized protein n=1 Tax=Aegilops tauschii subsp. strangulata TaxID=200361 RepID=A0A453DTZ2_AEGTS
MELRQAAGDFKDDGSSFMCSRLYVATFEGRTQEVAGLLAGRSGDAPPAAHSKVIAVDYHHGRPCMTREVTGEGNTLLHIAAGQGHGSLIAELCYQDSSLLSSVNRALDTPLHSAARAGRADAAEAVVRLARANVEEDALCGILRGRDDAGDTALHLAARHGHREAVERLMKLAPELAAEVDGAGVSSLYLAVMSGSVDAVRAIASHGDASAAGPSSQNALHAAVLQNQL